MQKELQKIKEEILTKLKEVKDSEFLSELETKYMGRKGELTTLLRSLSDLGADERKKIGKLANEIKNDIQQAFLDIRKELTAEDKIGFMDVTLPGKKIARGHIHPISLVQDELEDLFMSMGFMILEGPELESDFYNFEALNIPSTHPARDMQDTFYIDKKNKDGDMDLVMRTHTSPVQVRAMQEHGAPLRAVVPGRTFRCEATDVRHEHTFYQFEGLMVDKKINFSHLKGILAEIGKRLYGAETQVRMRPKFYPFVEPGANIEYTCFLCNGQGCNLCKKTGWLEVGGCGLIHPNVLKAGGIDPNEYTGFAFGFGLNRLTMLKYGIEDIRTFNSGDMRFLEQF
ncbi:phenylalanine--tRNA ligase subunit alpha [Candidatus Parcubacteria bacterium]|nr:phenylalanine--tRNA ligase subunit alpha [Patescibacteria group bacterium]MBU4309630.1 phenylalanine--tRNA ligase subunit alpha [Patescibacteria group bacterium]MBU4431934.1 phenylalanine--tRNA ligase subunit alpha [Patescibacteria group bacterium]MBU4577982.1 phenylalanine--tRNA ligase subunit alpha [Patescibacteria group bacterium]MCG2696509.1 phenylalanine--tRNA ligase subunit alpha [Candidatus Parcubacteria bacterium]